MGINAVVYAKISRPVDLPMIQETLTIIKDAAWELVYKFRAEHPDEFLLDSMVGDFHSFPPDLTSCVMNFRLGEKERRNLSITFRCHHDSDYLFEGQNILLSLSPWGSADLIMAELSKALTKLDFVEGAWHVPSDDDPDNYIKYEKEQ